MMIGNHRTERWRILGDGHTQIAVDFRHFDFDDAGAGALAQLAGGLAFGLRAHVLRCDGGMTDERHRMTRREILHLHVVIVGLGLEHERRFAVHLGRRWSAFPRPQSESASSTTMAGLPQKRWRVNAST